ncbi:hypothetical protein F4804DRAFT_354077 [Jackrogersella minutella]|nr:hypothetical protein F4804DRAFT_354077 [Jackrogersella minutella]
MNTYSLVTGVLFGAAQQINSPLFGSNHSYVIGSTAPTVIVNNSIVNIFESLTVNIPSPTSGSTTHTITTLVVVSIVPSIDATTSEKLVDSEPPRITIDTISATIRPQKITGVKSETATGRGAPAAAGRTDTSSPTSISEA